MFSVLLDPKIHSALALNQGSPVVTPGRSNPCLQRFALPTRCCLSVPYAKQKKVVTAKKPVDGAGDVNMDKSLC